MSILGDITGLGGLADLAKSIGQNVADVVGKLVPDATVVKQLQADTEKAATDAIAERYRSQAAVMVADSHSDSWLTRSIRPMVVLWGLGTITTTMVASWFGKAVIITSALSAVPDQLWNLVAGGVGIYVAGRSAEKVATTIAKAIKR